MANRSAILAIRIIADAAGAKKGFEDTRTGAQKFESGIGKASVVAAGALAAVTAAGLKAADSASRLGESANAVDKVFGPASSTIKEFGKTAAKSVGLAQSEFNELATSTGSLLTNFGYSATDAADQTTILAQRAADMASVFNTDVGTAMDAINAGLRGESEQLRKFGVNINDAALKAEALELGLYDGKGALDANAKAQATLSLVMEQSSKTAGDFADTADGAANRQRVLTAEWENAQATLGTALLPYLEQGMGILSALLAVVTRNTGTVKVLAVAFTAAAVAVLAINAAMKAYRATTAAVTAVQKVLTATQLRQTAATIAAKAASVAVRTATLVWTAAQWALNVALNANPIGLVVLAIAALIGALILAYKKSATFRNIVDAVGRALRTGLAAAVRTVSAVFGAMQTAVSRLGSALRGPLAGALRIVSGVFNAMKSAIRGAWEWVGNLIAKIGALVDKVKSLGGGLVGSIVGAVTGRAAYAPAPAAAFSAPGATSRATAVPSTTTTGGPPVVLTDEQVARALGRLLAGSAGRNGRVVMLT